MHLQATRHEKLNLPDSPCNASSDYDLGHCVEKSVYRRIGCQLPWGWGRVQVDGLPLCDNMTMLEKHTLEYWLSIEYGRDWLIKRTNCVLPCSYMEYTVSFKFI